MKRALAFASAAAMAMQVVGCSTPPLRVTESFSFSQPWNDYERIEVRTHNGKVELRSSDVTEIQVSGVKGINVWSLDDAHKALDDLSVQARPAPDRPDTLLVELQYPELLSQSSPGARLVIKIPEPCAADVRTSWGAIEVADLAGDVMLDTSHGSIKADRIAGELQATTSWGGVTANSIEGSCSAESEHGPLTVEGVGGKLHARTSWGDVRAKAVQGSGTLETSHGVIEAQDIGGELRAETSWGRVTVNGIAGPCTVRTSHGGVHLEGVQGDIRAATSWGDVRANVAPAPGRSVELRTNHGAITAIVPADFGANLDLKSSSGSLRTALGNAMLEQVESDDGRLTAVMNGGGGQLVARTSYGAITIESR